MTIPMKPTHAEDEPAHNDMRDINDMSDKEFISTSSEWTIDKLKEYDHEIGKIAKKYGLDTFPHQIEIITTEQMIDIYSAVGMPLGYNHWSFGKQLLEIEKLYKYGYMGLAYEVVINSNPCIAFLLEENSMMMQALVIAHAAYGHNSFFKNNYLFKTWTNPGSIIDYLVFSKNYVSHCEEAFGLDAVESMLDACHSLMNYGVDRYHHPPELSLLEEKIRQKKRAEYRQTQVNELWSTIPQKKVKEKKEKAERFPKEPQENLLYFIEKNAPLLEPWQREIIRIVRKIAQYFYPQRQTKVMNEGWASFWHYRLIYELYDRKKVSDEFMIEFLQLHTNVIFQLDFDHPNYSGLNPYTLGFNIFMDIKRICQHPTEEDHEWFPDLVNTDWIAALKFAMENFKDESFIAQYLSPHLIRKLKLFSIEDDDQKETLEITAIHNESGYKKIRETLSTHYDLSYTEPNIQIYNVDHRGDRSLTLRHIPHNRKPLSSECTEVIKHLYHLWGFPVKLESEQKEGSYQVVFECPASEVSAGEKKK